MLALAAVSLAATLGTLPLTALYFERVSVIGLAANMLVVPISGLSVVLGLAGVIADLVHHWAGDAYAALNAVLLHWTLRFTMLAGSSPIAVLQTSRWSLVESFGIVSAILTLFYLGTRVCRADAHRVARLWRTLLFWFPREHRALLLRGGSVSSSSMSARGIVHW